ncbi:hypothetical protein K504DRAFT_494669 [Pleomassaria siparia CBS 279.74]|uniref:Cytochrome P450 n=1 Tax=Pleomassaria siparia CBS 279.74 TaxID=1314801 RepID=A0A6G1JW98_9PLEO|nr:hypothetical protein K504DRAFT_494669 [Pleomassaria siparia CBS 279.74]
MAMPLLSFTQLPLLALTVIFIPYSIALAIYRLYFHPLAKFPGPKLTAATKWRVYQPVEPILRSQIDAFCHRLRTLYVQGKVTNIRINYLSTATEIVSLYAFGHDIGLHDSADEALDWLLTVKTIAAVSPFFKQYPYIS